MKLLIATVLFAGIVAIGPGVFADVEHQDEYDQYAVLCPT
jgi:hypothetical protein